MRQVPESMHAPRTWNLVAPGYGEAIAPMFTKFAEDALRLASIYPGERVLDVACGPGTLALAAARAGAQVTAVDFSPQMIAELRRRAEREAIEGIDVELGDATALPYDGATFDAAFSMFALNLVEDRAAAFRELRRVVREGGRAVVGTPRTLDPSRGVAAVVDVVRRWLPDVPVGLDDLPLSDPAELLDEMTAGGFREAGVRVAAHSFEFPSIGELWALAGRAAAPIVLAREQLGEDAWREVSPRIVSELERRFGAGAKRIEIAANLAIGRC